jgi:glycosyltransferase involved in cell wall biosynthesis
MNASKQAANLLDIFVLSRNRGTFIGQAIQSLLSQTFQDFRLIVLDNASSDNTESVVRCLAATKPIEFLGSSENLGVKGNIARALRLVRAPWAMLFHDDDLLHCRYLEQAFRAIGIIDRCNVVGCNYQDGHTISLEEFNEQYPAAHHYGFHHLRDKSQLASFCYTDNRIGFGSIIYRSESLSQTALRLQTFGKLCDRPFLIDAVGDGAAVVFKDPLMVYRIHAHQDSKDVQSGPFLHEALELARFYRAVMGDSWRSRSGKSFRISNRAFLKYMYKWCSNRTQMPFYEFVLKAFQEGAATWWSFIPRPLSRFIKKQLRARDPEFY